jgi:hypothetical protein
MASMEMKRAGFVLMALLLFWGAGSARAAVVSGPYGISHQVNVNAQGQNIPGDAANEPSICIDPTHPNLMAIGWRQFDTTNSNFRQGVLRTRRTAV